MRQSLSRRIATAAVSTRFEDFSPEVVTKLKLCLLDLFACAFEARDLPWSQRAATIAGREPGTATVLATGASATPGGAAFANGVAGHGLVREDMHAGAVSHLGVVVLPALLALAERVPVNGRDFIAAGIAGYETGAKIGRALITPELARFFRPTGFTGPLAAAIAGSRLLRLDTEHATRALGFAANTTGGLNQWPHEGSDDMFFHPGFAARNALTCVELAELGGESSEGALDGPAGLLTAYLGGKAIPDITLFDGPPELLAVYNKPVPACNFAQTPCQAALVAAENQPLAVDPRPRDPDRRTLCGGPLSGLRLCRPVPQPAAGEDEHPVQRRRGPALWEGDRDKLRGSERCRDPAPRPPDQARSRCRFHRRLPSAPGRTN